MSQSIFSIKAPTMPVKPGSDISVVISISSMSVGLALADVLIEFNPRIVNVKDVIVLDASVSLDKSAIKSGLIRVNIKTDSPQLGTQEILELIFRTIDNSADRALISVLAAYIKYSDSSEAYGINSKVTIEIATQQLEIDVASPLLVRLPQGSTSDIYFARLPASGGKPPYKWDCNGLPEGLVVSAEGVVTGKLSLVGNLTFEGEVSDSSNPPQKCSACFEIPVTAGPLSIPPHKLDDCIVGQLYSGCLKAIGGVAPYTWNLSTGNLPKGLNLSRDGNFDGYCLEAGSFLLKLQVTDSTGQEADGIVLMKAKTLYNPIICASVKGANGVLALPNLVPQPYILTFETENCIPGTIFNNIRAYLMMDDLFYWSGTLSIGKHDINVMLPGGPHLLKLIIDKTEDPTNLILLRKLIISTDNKHIRPANDFPLCFDVLDERTHAIIAKGVKLGKGDILIRPVMMPGSSDDLLISWTGGVELKGLDARGKTSQENSYSYTAPAIAKMIWTNKGVASGHTLIGISPGKDSLTIMSQSQDGNWSYQPLPLSKRLTAITHADMDDNGKAEIILATDVGVSEISTSGTIMAGPWSTLGATGKEEVDGLQACNIDGTGNIDVLATNRFGGSIVRLDKGKTISSFANSSPGLLSEYFDWPVSLSAMPDLTGKKPDFVTVDSQLNFPSTLTPWPGLDTRYSDTFASRHTGYIKIDIPGEYTLYLNSDDGSRLYLDGKKLIDNDGLHSMVEKLEKVTLTIGYHKLVVEFFENSGGAGLILSYSGPGLPKQVIPAEVLFHDAEGKLLVADKGQPIAITVRRSGFSEPLIVASACVGDDMVRTYNLNYEGLMQPVATVQVGAGPSDVILADITGRSRSDIVTADRGSSSVTVVLKADMGYGVPEHYRGPSGTKVVTIARGAMGELNIIALGENDDRLMLWRSPVSHPACQVFLPVTDIVDIEPGAARLIPQDILIGNAGIVELNLQKVVLTGSLAGKIHLPNIPILPRVVLPGDVLSLDIVALGDENPGKKNSTIDIWTDDPLYPVISIPIQLTTTARTCPGYSAPDILWYGQQSACSQSIKRRWTISAITSTIWLDKVWIMGRNANKFKISSPTEMPILIGKSNAIDISIQADISTAGSLMAEVIAELHTDNEVFLKACLLHAEVLEPPMPNVVLRSPQYIGSTKINVPIDNDLFVENDGMADLIISSGTISGKNKDEFRVSANWPLKVPELRYNRDINITFSPVTSGNKTAVLTLLSNDPKNPSAKVDLLGVGYIVDIHLIPDMVHFTGILETADSPSAEIEVTLYNFGPAEGHIAATVEGPFEIISPLFPIDIVGYVDVRIKAKNPGNAGTYMGKINFATDDPLHPTLRLQIIAVWYHQQ